MASVQSTLEDFLGSDEPVVFQTRQHPFVILWEVLKLAAILAAGAVLVWGSLTVGWLANIVGVVVLWAAVALMVVAVGRGLWVILGWHSEHLVISTEKVVFVTGILNRHVHSTPLVKIDELSVSQPFLGRVFGYGTLVVENASDDGHQTLYGLGYIPDPSEVYRVITDSARRERMTEGGAIPAPESRQ